MGLVSGNRLNRFWKKGVKPIKDAIGVLAALSTVDKETLVGAINELAEGKFDVAKLVASTNVTEPGFAMDAKTASEAFAELYSKLDNGGNGYAKLPDGTLIQYGTVTGSEWMAGVTCAIPFETSNYCVCITSIAQSGTGAVATYGVLINTIRSFYVYSAGNSINAFYVAIGRWK